MDKRCACCKKIFIPRPAVRNQQYCSESECQKMRKRQWQKEKLVTDRAYRENQADAQKQWCSRNKPYWKEYRKRHPEYAERNRQKQRERNLLRRAKAEIAKMDEQKGENVITSGRYRLQPIGNRMIAKMDELIVEIGVISRGCVIGVQGQ